MMNEQFLVYQRLIEQYEDRIRKLAMINEEQSLMIAEMNRKIRYYEKCHGSDYLKTRINNLTENYQRK